MLVRHYSIQKFNEKVMHPFASVKNRRMDVIFK